MGTRRRNFAWLDPFRISSAGIFRISSAASFPSFASSLQFTLFMLLLVIPQGLASKELQCMQRFCDTEFARAAQINKVLEGSNLPFCLLLQQYRDCLEQTSRPCRGQLRFHSTLTLTNRMLVQYNCTKLVETQTEIISYGGESGSSGSPGSPDDQQQSRCLYPYQHQKGSSGYRYCGLFGDPHIRTFDGQQETCQTHGAWPLVDNAYLAVQVTNEPIGIGVKASKISKVTVIVRALSGCTEAKTYEATSSELPSAFIDGSMAASSKSVLVTSEIPGEKVEIHLRYVSTKVIIRKFDEFLSVAIKMPEEVIKQRSSVSALQLCVTGCPSAERISFMEVLAFPHHYVRRLGLDQPMMNREDAISLCKQAGTTDFFFDSCVFDLILTGNRNLAVSAATALIDIRHLYSPYQRHYETNRTDLNIYAHIPPPPIDGNAAANLSSSAMMNFRFLWTWTFVALTISCLAVCR